MRMLFYLGWAFLILAFAAASAEAIPRSMLGDYGFFVSAYELWYAAWPGNLVVTQIQVEKLSPVLWDPVLVGILALPAWFLFALPGVTLVWFCRPHREMSEADREDLAKQEESLLLYDQLAREAKEAGYDDSDDRTPDYEGHRLIDSDGGAYPEDAKLGDLEFDEAGGTEGAGEGGGGDGEK